MIADALKRVQRRGGYHTLTCTAIFVLHHPNAAHSSKSSSQQAGDAMWKPNIPAADHINVYESERETAGVRPRLD